MSVTAKIPRQGGRGAFLRQLRAWGRDVVLDLIKAAVKGDGRRIAVVREIGGVAITFMETPQRNYEFHGAFRRGSHLGTGDDTLVIRAGNVRHYYGTYSVAEQEISPPASGDLYVWLRIVYDLTDSSLAVTIQTGSSLPAFGEDADSDPAGTKERINWPLGVLAEIQSSAVWEWQPIHEGTVHVETLWHPGVAITEYAECVDVRYDTGTGRLEKKLRTVAAIKGVWTKWGTTTWALVAQSELCPTTTTTTTT